MIIDSFGYMALSCLYLNATCIYSTANVSYTGMIIAYQLSPWFIKFDLNSRFILISPLQIDIYY